MPIFVAILIAIIGGIAAALQSQAMSVMTTRAGTIESVFITYGSGGLAIGLAILFMRGGKIDDLKGAPLWVYTAGVLGLIVVGTLGLAASRIGLARTLTLFTAASLILGAVLDHFGVLGTVTQMMTVPRLVGLAMVLAGTWLVVG